MVKNHFGSAASAGALLVVVSVVCLLWMLGARVMAPSEAWDQDQPKTMGYTVDVLVNGRWVLPREQGHIKASKPPLYNWIAAPAVRIGGFSSEIAHKFPSWAALIAAWALLVWTGQSRLARVEGRWEDGPRTAAQGVLSVPRTTSQVFGSVGWLAGIMLVSTYTVFKIGYTARPDMILCLFLFLGWIFATVLLIRAGDRHEFTQVTESGHQNGEHGTLFLLALGFWVCVGLAALAKGPPALLLVLYALLGSRFMAGSWRKARVFGMWWGIPVGAGMFALWLWGVYRVDPEHLIQRLWFDEVFGRVTGLSDQGNRAGPIEFLRRLFHVPFYFLVRFIPWSILATLAVIHLWARDPETGRARWRSLPGIEGRWLHGGAIWMVLVLVFFSLSTGVRADYIAPAFFPASLLAAWWVLRAAPQLIARRWWAVPTVAAVILAAMTKYQFAQPQAYAEGFGQSITTFIRVTEEHVTDEPAPLEFWHAGRIHVQTYLGAARPEDHDALLDQFKRGGMLWVVAGLNHQEPERFPDWLAEQASDAPIHVEAVHQTMYAPRGSAWAGQLTLYRVRAEPPPSTNRAAGRS